MGNGLPTGEHIRGLPTEAVLPQMVIVPIGLIISGFPGYLSFLECVTQLMPPSYIMSRGVNFLQKLIDQCHQWGWPNRNVFRGF